MKALSLRIDITIDDIGGEDMAGVRIRITQEVGEGNSRKRIVVGEIVLKELHGDGFINKSSDVEIETRIDSIVEKEIYW